MVQAARPGAGKRREAAAAAAALATITVRGETHKIAIGSIPLREKIAVRKACGGLPFEAFWSGEDRIGDDSVKVLWWLARRADGETDLTLDEVDEQWPKDLVEDDILFVVDEPDPQDDHPEASGPSSVQPGPS